MRKRSRENALRRQLRLGRCLMNLETEGAVTGDVCVPGKMLVCRAAPPLSRWAIGVLVLLSTTELQAFGSGSSQQKGRNPGRNHARPPVCHFGI